MTAQQANNGNLRFCGYWTVALGLTWCWDTKHHYGSIDEVSEIPWLYVVQV